eukprot:TRINITY_DN104664_c0_g1_i1.p1 TRINITY_DN104664_c0_g1~~TRINITY_DN104664_c0_g1_i1.p1  ORF type:complete len:213 (+),score=39.69 TRINITY_DN104664_c0_g1_i1:37-675(+)
MAAPACETTAPARRKRLLGRIAWALLLCTAGQPWVLTSRCWAAGSQASRGRGLLTLRQAGFGTDIGDDTFAQRIKEWKKTRPPEPEKAEKPAAPPEEPQQAEPEPPVSRQLSQLDAVGQLLKIGEREGVVPGISAQQTIMLIFSFFRGFRDRNGMGDIELDERQKQLLIVKVQFHLSIVGSMKAFWVSFCSDLGSKSPEMRDLLFGLTGLRD